ncbi:HpcH/HpaI aldolase/citrate lyase family protein [Cohnella hashimotonis]|uniref:HpcH/HpaI aldolase/citrate lyase family protein n=1 Tax=Cohnella hashimotonis TaxID=2826895 RepID=A0ABT6TD15_9BACL|nr:HpcH/HpaI aldolase/citrate lyase family protein [Cohnella hashimotonis]MDI4644722.1 HpcH/HpaI aldolase/citrate lyase family protein [Cohnella hashimotonis]
MRYFNYLTPDSAQSIFYRMPEPFNNGSDKELIAHAVGAALYMPATKETIAEDLVSSKHEGLVSVVIDLEDAIGDNQVHMAEQILLRQLAKLEHSMQEGHLAWDKLPLLFVRVRSALQLSSLLERLGDSRYLLTGFVFPKFTPDMASEYFDVLTAYNANRPQGASVLYGMPILETPEIIYLESRSETLHRLSEQLALYKPYVLNVRIGATDFSSLFGLRRSPDNTIYDIGVIRDCIADIVNVFGRTSSGYVISGPVWEYFKSDRLFKPQLRQTPFEESMGYRGKLLRMSYVNRYEDGLLREVAMDKENGIAGKTIIHPSHIKPVQAMYVVTHEEYLDALHIRENDRGHLGVMGSAYANKMNEIKPHLSWANRILMRARIYGVLHENQNYTCLLAEERQSATV